MSTIDATPLADEIAAFAASVRHHLDDLPADEADELMDGLEADLGEQAVDNGADFTLPDAAAYAAELRSAAGLPPRIENAKAPTVRTLVARRVSARLRRLRAHPASSGVIDFLVSLRPAWWLARALIVFEAITIFARGTWIALDLLGVILLAACVVVNVQWGRARWLPARGGEWLIGIVNVAAWVALPFLLVGGLNTYVQSQQYSSGQLAAYGTQPGLTSDGARVRNIFAYDAAGQPLTGVQLFDQDGRPLTTVGQEGLTGDWEADLYFLGGGGPVPVAERGAGFRPIWNVYPLPELPAYTDPWMEGATAAVPRPPFPAVPVIETGTTTSPTTSPTVVAPTASGFPNPTATPGSEQTPAPTP